MEIQTFSRKCIWKCGIEKGGDFVLASIKVIWGILYILHTEWGLNKLHNILQNIFKVKPRLRL